MKKLSIEDRDLLLKDLCARSFYSVKVTVPIMSFIKGQDPYTEPIELVSVNAVDMTCTVGDRHAQTSGIKMFNRKGELVCKPYLRPMSSMTEEEMEELEKITYHTFKYKKGDCEIWTNSYHRVQLFNGAGELYGAGEPTNMLCSSSICIKLIDWLNAHHFDYRGLIEKGLAIEAPKGMYI